MTATADSGPASVALTERPIFFTMNEERRELIRKKVSRGFRSMVPTDTELAGFLELCHRYDLDPMADEVWLSKTEGKDGREPQLLVMVGRNGLRKIARRQKLALVGDVVHEKDVFRVSWKRDPDTKRRELWVEHSYEGASEESRGKVLGSWAEVYRESDGAQMGYFFAPIGEYKPENEKVLKFSPWGHQESVMILTAAERTALRQATPLGGLLGEGEDALLGEGGDAPLDETEVIKELIQDLPDVSAGLKTELYEAMQELNGLSPNAWGLGRAQMTLPGRDEESLRREVEDIRRQIAEAQARKAREATAAVEEVTDAVVVEDEPAEESRTTDGRRYGEPPAPGDVAEAAGEAARGNPGPQEALAAQPCPMCDKDWEEHSDAEKAECRRAADEDAAAQ
jgi:hypothetical protein